MRAGERTGGDTQVELAGASGGQRYWWVNQGQTYRDEVPGGFLWSPKMNKGSRSPYYDNMTRIQAGDLVLSYWGGAIRAVGVAAGPAVSQQKPDFETGDPGWDDEGWLVPVDFAPLATPVAPVERIEAIRPLLPSRLSPINRADSVHTAYLFEISEELTAFLLDWSGHAVVAGPSPDDVLGEAEADLAVFERSHDGLSPTEREEIRKARRGQGQFRRNLLLYERRCRVTGTGDQHHLRASHIKPWRASTNAERLDGCNGLLLAPHIDHLFDRGWISFTGDGLLLAAPQLGQGVLDEWSVQAGQRVGSFNARQSRFLAYHRDEILKG